MFGATSELNIVLHLALVKNGHMAVNAPPPRPVFPGADSRHSQVAPVQAG